jgi:hypothetical protein
MFLHPQNRRLKRQQGGNAVASLLPLPTAFSNRLVLCLGLGWVQSEIFQQNSPDYPDQCPERVNDFETPLIRIWCRFQLHAEHKPAFGLFREAFIKPKQVSSVRKTA